MGRSNNHLLFIINSIAGGSSQNKNRAYIESQVRQFPSAESVYTEYSGHAHILAESAANNGYDTIVAVGGDGTVNEVASALICSTASLGIVPLGSGNGLARHMGISMHPDEAIEAVMENEPMICDSAAINGIPYFCTSGIGFDAQVANDYAKAGTRGLSTYVKKALQDWNSYEPVEYSIETEEGTLRTKALLITAGNANQWGNNYFIAPEASLQDGKLDITIIKPSSIISYARMFLQLRNKSLYNNQDVIHLRSSYANIECSRTEIAAHFDGEATTIGGKAKLECRHNSIRIIPGNRYKTSNI